MSLGRALVRILLVGLAILIIGVAAMLLARSAR